MTVISKMLGVTEMIMMALSVIRVLEHVTVVEMAGSGALSDMRGEWSERPCGESQGARWAPRQLPLPSRPGCVGMCTVSHCVPERTQPSC